MKIKKFAERWVDIHLSKLRIKHIGFTALEKLDSTIKTLSSLSSVTGIKCKMMNTK